jgi:hypothetical protein
MSITVIAIAIAHTVRDWLPPLTTGLQFATTLISFGLALTTASRCVQRWTRRRARKMASINAAPIPRTEQETDPAQKLARRHERMLIAATHQPQTTTQRANPMS